GGLGSSIVVFHIYNVSFQITYCNAKKDFRIHEVPEPSASLWALRIRPSFHPTPKGVGFPAQKFCNQAEVRLLKKWGKRLIRIKNWDHVWEVMR
ncbi:hypothetical protein, partial [Exiguobacterium antarcticum]|uniref:hypothetical protein n=1 Tax=Exiguobacterium antarcticum TaxID=132920 RepID=UPI0021C4A134